MGTSCHLHSKLAQQSLKEGAVEDSDSPGWPCSSAQMHSQPRCLHLGPLYWKALAKVVFRYLCQHLSFYWNGKRKARDLKTFSPLWLNAQFLSIPSPFLLPQPHSLGPQNGRSLLNGLPQQWDSSPNRCWYIWPSLALFLGKKLEHRRSWHFLLFSLLLILS